MKSVILVLAIGLAACSGGNSPCESFGKKLCDEACDCVEGDACAMQLGISTVSFDTESDCRGYFVTQRCGEERSETFDYEGCSAALDNASCGTSASDEPVFVYPSDPVCH